jgi:phage terminase Nu1 subunit (DNA packaging protein)
MTDIDPVGTAEAAEILKVEVQRITRWRKNGKLPTPARELAATAVWHREDIEWVAGGGDPKDAPNGKRLPSLLGLSEAADELGVNKSQIGRWRRAERFPAPNFELTAGPLWWRKDIKAWEKNRG